MRLYAEQGQPTRVLQQYQALEKALCDDEGFSPTEATRKLAETLRQKAAELLASLPSLPPRESVKPLPVQPADTNQDLAVVSESPARNHSPIASRSR